MFAGVYKEFKTGKIGNLKSTGIAAIAGTVARILDDDTVQLQVSAWDRDKKEVTTKKYEVDLAEMGGADPDAVVKGSVLCVIGDIDSDNVIHAKNIGMGDSYLTYKGYGIAMGETSYKESKAYGGEKNQIVATIKSYDNENDRYISNKFTINGYQDDTKPQDMLKKSLDIKAKNAGVTTVSRNAKYPWEQVKFNSCVVFKEDNKISKTTGRPHNEVKEFTPTEGNNAGTTFYIRYEYAPYAMTSECVGDITEKSLEAYKAREEKAAQYTEEHANVKEEAAPEVKAEEKGDEDTPFEIDENANEMNYDE